jgi:hypothetical protein
MIYNINNEQLLPQLFCSSLHPLSLSFHIQAVLICNSDEGIICSSAVSATAAPFHRRPNTSQAFPHRTVDSIFKADLCREKMAILVFASPRTFCYNASKIFKI